MARLPFGLSAYSRADGRLAPIRQVNHYIEQSPTSPGGVTALRRPGLVESVNAAVRGVYREDGVFDGDLFTVRAGALYRGETSLGSIAGTDRAQFAYTVDGLFILGGGIVYQYDGAAKGTTAFPDGALVASITQINNILVAVRADTGTIYFRLAGDTVWNALDFFSAERKPDPAIAVWALGDFLYVFGTATVELFGTTGDAAVPFLRIDGASINRGLKDRDCIAGLDNTLFFIGEDNIGYRLDSVPQRVSDHGIEERFQLSTTAKAFTYTWAGHTFWVVGLDTETLVYDVAGGWAVYEKDGGAFPSLGLYDGQTTYVGGDKLWTFADVNTDDGAAMERVITAILPASAPVICECVEVQLSPGVTATGEEAAIVQLRYSDSQGREWSDWRSASTGMAGEYRKRVRFRRLGMADAPGRAFEIRTTDDADIRFSEVNLNPPNGGRGR